MNWRDFWNRENSIYVNDRHRALHDERVARDIAALVEAPGWLVFDHGCGEASCAGVVAEKCELLHLYDAAPMVRDHLRARFAGNPRISVRGEGGLAEVSDGALDLVVVNSVLQYLTQAEFESFLEVARNKLKPGGKLVVADVIPKGARAIDDIAALLTFAREGGFFLAALSGLVTTFFSDYRKLRAEIGLTRYAEPEMLTIFRSRGFKAARAPKNIGHNQTRMLFVATPD